jgi:hypothetical protein
MVKSLRFLAGTLATSLFLFGLVAAPASATSTAADCEDLSLVAILHVTSGVDFEGTSGNDIICGTAGDDVINGGGGNDIVYGLDGNDTIITGSGIDTIDGGAGNDTITSGAGADAINGGAGDDTIKSGDGNDTIRSGDGDDEIDAGNGNDIVFAEADDDNVDGEAGNDEINLGDGDDYAEGGAGADKLWGGDGSDSLIGESGNDWVSGGDGDDTIKLDAGDDYALGGPGADLLFGGKGEDALNAETGSDSLDGGAGADSVNGGTNDGNDKDYCAKDKLDTQKNCFYDSKGPRLISVAVSDGGRVNTSESGQIVTIRARVVDGGSGVAHIYLPFSRLNKDGFAVGDSIHFSFSPWAWGCDPNNPNTLNLESAGSSIGCRISGNDLNGIYEFKTVIPKHSMPGTYVLHNASMTDAAGNSSHLPYEKLKEKKLAVNFKQVGAGDGKGPTLSSISLLTKSVNTSASSQVVTLRAAVKDGTSGVQNVQFSFARLTNSQGAWQNIGFNWHNPGAVGNGDCVDGGAADPTVGNYSSCRVSGNNKAQVVEMKVRLPRYTSKGTYQLQFVNLRDYAGNSSYLMLEQLKDRKMAVNFKQTGAGDSSGPTLKKVTVLTPKIDTGAAPQIVTMRVQVRDNNSGVKDFGLQFGRIKSGQSDPVWANIYSHWSPGYDWDSSTNTQIVIPEGTCNSAKTGAKDPVLTNGMGSGTACRISGTARDGMYEVKVIVPAHAASGTYKLVNFYANDNANNQRNVGWFDLKKKKLNIGFKNG